MRIGSTPTHTFVLPEKTDIFKTAKITYCQTSALNSDEMEIILTKYLDDCEVSDNTLIVKLTQEETFLFDNNKIVEIQLRVVTVSGDALTSDPIIVTTKACFDNEVLE